MTSVIKQLLKRPSTRRRNVERLAISSPNGIRDERFVDVGGIQQWLTIRGEDQGNPVLLFLHGGPGMGQTMFNPIIRPWERDFTLVQWDQRGSGKTRDRSGSARRGELTLARLEADAVEVAEFLRAHLGQDKLILLASSVGSTFGVSFARRRPDLLHAYVGTDQNVGVAGSALSYRLTLDWLRESGNAKAVADLERIGPDPERWTRKQDEALVRWAIRAHPTAPQMIRDVVMPAMLGSPEHRMRDLRTFAKGMKESNDQLYQEIAAFDARLLGADFAIPVFIFQGEADAVTPAGTAKDYLDWITAPHKEFAPIRDAGHLAMFAQPEQFHTELTHRVRPFAVRPLGRASHER